MEDQMLTQQSFANLIGVATATLSSIFNDRTKPSLNIVDAIKKKFPNINLEWLLYGTEPMYINEQPEQPIQKGNNSAGGDAYPIDGEPALDFADVPQQSSPSLFDTPQVRGVNNTPKKIAQTEVKFIDKPQRKITEIRIFYDDQTWETFVPKK